MLKCGSEFGTADWDSRYDFVPKFADLKRLPVDAYLAEVRARHRRYNDIPFSMMAEASFKRLKRLRYIVTCLDEHGGGSAAELLERWPQFRSSGKRCRCLAPLGSNTCRESPEPGADSEE
jgi:hypothetical protein